MAVYAYKVRDMSGKILSGTLDAENEGAVVTQLRGKNYLIMELKPHKVNNSKISLPRLSKRVKAKELAVFCRQFATMMNAGVPILVSIRILGEQAENVKLKETLEKVITGLESGKSLADSLRPFPKVFPSIFVNMIETGEVGGILDEVLERLAAHFEREHDIYEKVKSAMTYPIAIMIIASVAIIFMLVFILPNFVSMLMENGAELPLPTKIVLGMSNILRNFWWLILLLFAGSSYGLKKALEKESGREFMDATILKIPVIGMLVQKMIVSRFSRTLGTMLRSGVPIIEALETTQKTTGNAVVAKGVKTAKENVTQGKGISQPLTDTGVFPPMVTQMIAIGEETGALDSLLEKVAIFYDREVDDLVSRLSSLIEPLMIVGIGLILGFIILAMMMPMFEIMTNAN